VSAVAFFRLKCDGDCGRWLSDVTTHGLAKMTSVWGRALTFTTDMEAVRMSMSVGWTKCAGCPASEHLDSCEVVRGVSLCGNCRAKKGT